MPVTTQSGYSRPTFDEELASRRAAYAAEFGPVADDSVLARMAEIDAKMLTSLYAYIEFEAQQMMPLYAVGQRLLDWGAFLLGDKKVATTATGTAIFSGSDGTDIPLATQMQIGSVVYQSTAGATIASGAATVPIVAAVAGTSGNASTGVTISLVSPISGVTSDGAVAAPGLTGGAAAETDEEYRSRILLRLQDPPSGGNDTDYESWALAVSGVTRAWVQRGSDGTGQVSVLFMMDDTYSPGIPVGAGAPAYSGDLLTVYTALKAKAPDPAVVYAVAPTPKPIDVTISGLSPSTTAMKTAVEAQLQDVFLRRAAPGKVVRKSWITEAIALAAGEDGYDDLVLPSLSVVCGATEIGVLGTVTYV